MSTATTNRPPTPAFAGVSAAAGSHPHPDVLRDLAAARGALQSAAEAEPWRLSEFELVEAIEATLAAESALVAVRAGLVREADQRGVRQQTQAPTTERWLTQRMRLSRAQANRVVAESDVLAAAPEAASALAAGACTPEQAHVIAATLHDLPAVDDAVRERAAALLVHQAAALDPAALARAGRHLHETLTTAPDADDPTEARALDDSEADDRATALQAEADRMHALRSLIWRRHVDGTVTGRFRLDPVAGATFLVAITALARRTAAGRPDAGRPDAGQPVENQPADGDLCPQGAAGPPVGSPTADQRTGPQRAADALTTIARLATMKGLPTRGGIRPTLVVTTTLDGLQRRLSGTGLLPGGVPVDPASLRRLACDAGVLPAVLGGPGQVLDLGRARRLFSPAQRQALALRDRGCVHPGCARDPDACEAHHLRSWQLASGPTDLANAALLCDHHHDQLHRQGWIARLAPNGYPELIPPSSIDQERLPRQHHRFLVGRVRQ